MKILCPPTEHVKNLTAVSAVYILSPYFLNGQAKERSAADMEAEGAALLLHLFVLRSAHSVTLTIWFGI